jgi:transcriptional regulator with XRE-family HTH domain
MPTHTIDLKRLYEAADLKRREQGKSWRQVARDLDLGIARFSWISAGGSISVETFATILAWLDADVERFLVPLEKGTRARPAATAPAPTLSGHLKRWR